jgi:prefoldin subunit 5
MGIPRVDVERNIRLLEEQRSELKSEREELMIKMSDIENRMAKIQRLIDSLLGYELVIKTFG